MTDYLSAEERDEYDELMFAAGYSDGKPRPSHEIGRRVLDELAKADQAHCSWAQMVLDDIAEAGALARWKSWHKRKVVVDLGEEMGDQVVVTTKAAAMSVKRQNDSGATYYQSTMWEDMTREELLQVVDRANRQIKAEQKTIVLAQKLLDLLDRVPEARTAAEAAKALGTTVNDWLVDPEERAA